MESMFQENLTKLTKKYTQKYVAEKTGFSQSSINNYLTKASEPSIQFLIALKNAFGICVDDFLFTNYQLEDNVSYDKFVGNYLVYYYNNDSYKGEVHTNLKNTLNYGVLSIYKNREFDATVRVNAIFSKERAHAVELLKMLNSTTDIAKIYEENMYTYTGSIATNEHSIFLTLSSKAKGDESFIILSNPPTKQNYMGGIGAVNSIARGREHNPCIQFAIISKRLLDVPDGELYNILKFDDYSVDMEGEMNDIIDLFKRLYADNNELSVSLTENQKQAIVRNKLEFHFNEILDANVFRFAKVSNKEDDAIYRLIKEGKDV